MEGRFRWREDLDGGKSGEEKVGGKRESEMEGRRS